MRFRVLNPFRRGNHRAPSSDIAAILSAPSLAGDIGPAVAVASDPCSVTATASPIPTPTAPAPYVAAAPHMSSEAERLARLMTSHGIGQSELLALMDAAEASFQSNQAAPTRTATAPREDVQAAAVRQQTAALQSQLAARKAEITALQAEIAGYKAVIEQEKAEQAAREAADIYQLRARVRQTSGAAPLKVKDQAAPPLTAEAADIYQLRAKVRKSVGVRAYQ